MCYISVKTSIYVVVYLTHHLCVVEKGLWEVLTITGEEEEDDAGNAAEVVIVIYGEKGKSAQLPLVNDQENYKPGQTDRFQVRMQYGSNT